MQFLRSEYSLYDQSNVERSLIENNAANNHTSLNVPDLISALILQAKQGQTLLILGWGNIIEVITHSNLSVLFGSFVTQSKCMLSITP